MIQEITTDILTAFYEPLWFALLAAVLVMFLILYMKETGKNLKNSAETWIRQFRSQKKFRFTFLLAFYTAMILFRTLLNRELWMNPLSDVMGGWLYVDGAVNSEAVENFVLFIPFILLLFTVCEEKEKIILKSAKISFLFSLTIELCQVILRLGTFQFADLFFNITGGIFAGMIFWTARRIKKS